MKIRELEVLVGGVDIVMGPRKPHQQRRLVEKILELGNNRHRGASPHKDGLDAKSRLNSLACGDHDGVR